MNTDVAKVFCRWNLLNDADLRASGCEKTALKREKNVVLNWGKLLNANLLTRISRVYEGGGVSHLECYKMMQNPAKCYKKLQNVADGDARLAQNFLLWCNLV